MASRKRNGGHGIRRLARAHAAEAMDRLVVLMRQESDQHAASFACYAILQAALSHPAEEHEDEAA